MEEPLGDKLSQTGMVRRVLAEHRRVVDVQYVYVTCGKPYDPDHKCIFAEIVADSLIPQKLRDFFVTRNDPAIIHIGT